MKIGKAVFHKRIYWLQKNILMRQGNMLMKNLNTILQLKNKQKVIVKNDTGMMEKNKAILLKQFLRKNNGIKLTRRLKAIKQYF